MVLRPVDENGDILPVLTPSELFRGVEAEKTLITDRLRLLQGDWWENETWGNMIIALLKENRYTEADQQLLASYLSSYIRETKGVVEVKDMAFHTEGRQFFFSCIVETESGTAVIDYAI